VIGTELGRYRITALVGEGGMGSVYLAVQPAIGSRVAIKVLSEQCARDAELLERFFAEAKAVNLIRHEHIVSVLDLATLPDGRPYIVMEYIEGQTLAAMVRGKAAPLGGVMSVMGEVLSALAAAHAIGIVHRDLKPDNVLVTAEGHAKVLDFGIAKLAPGLHDASSRTKTGALLGTPAYMAPEQISGAGSVDARADIYAAGILLYEAVTGRVPFSGGSIFDVMRAQVEQTPAPPRSLRADLPEPIEAVILTALQKDPALRFQSAQAMAQALAHAAQALAQHQWIPLSSRGGPRISASGGGQPTPQITPVAPSMAAPPRRSGVIVGVLAVLAVAIGIGLFVASRSSSEDKIAPPPPPPPSVDAAVAPPIDAARVVVAKAPPPVDAALAPAHKAKADAGPTIVNGGSAADHGVYIGTGVEIGSNVVIGSQTPARPAHEARAPADYDPKHFDPVAYLPRARALAKKLMPDAELIELEFYPVHADGSVDLTARTFEGDFRFRSKAASVLPPGTAPNEDVDIPCLVFVEPGPREAVATVHDSMKNCKERLIRAPHCSMASVWKQELALGVPGDFVAKIGWLFDETWFFDVNDATPKAQTTIQDRCP
jgi:serine/threonine protein kinase